MAKISELISKYVISLYNGQVEGIIENVLFDAQTYKIKYLIVYNNENELTYLLPTHKIYSSGNGAVAVRNSGGLILYENKELEVADLCNPINSMAFSISGDKLGKIADIEINANNEIVSFILTNSEVVLRRKIASFNSKTSIINTKEEKVNLKNFFERKKIPNNDSRVVNILELNSKPIQSENTKPIPTVINTLVPNKAITNFDFLINRKVKKNILSQNGSLIIKENSKINNNIINVARLNGKLKELTKYSN